MANKKQLEVNLSIDPAVGTILADERRLKQMLVNLLSNAVKFTPVGGAIGLEITASEDDDTVYCAVWDTGIGIAPEDMRHLFQPFVQLDSGHTRQYGGTGLGLVLVNRMAQLHGGTVRVESEVGRGSRFTVALPWRRPAAEGADAREATQNRPEARWEALPEIGICPCMEAANDAADLSEPAEYSCGPLVLLAEDNDANIAALTAYLETLHFRLIIAKNGREAVEQAQAHHPDLILMDVQMPEMDGLEATRRMRSDPALAQIPIVAMTAQVMPGDRERCLEAGVNDFVGKPISIERLAEVLDLHLSAERMSPST